MTEDSDAIEVQVFFVFCLPQMIGDRSNLGGKEEVSTSCCPFIHGDCQNQKNT